MLNRGFTLIEVLVTLVILMFGLLGIAGLIMKGQRASYEAYQRQQALAIATDLAEKIKANQRQVAAYIAIAPLGTPAGEGELYDDIGIGILNCEVVACTPADLAAYDVAIWDGLLQGTTETIGGARVGGIINARGCIEDRTGAIANTYRVSVAWQGEQATVAPTISTCGEDLYGTEEQRRVVTLDITLQP